MGGLDWGVETFATIATPEATKSIDNPRYLARTLNAIRRVQQDISRKEKAAKKASGKTRSFPVSNRLRREYERLRRLHEKVANQRHDFLHQTTARLVGEGAFHRLLKYKAEEAGAWAMEAPTQQVKPSQTCHACGRQEKKPLGQRRHECPCGASCSRDENAARVLLAWVEQQLSGREPADAWRTVRPANPPGEPARPSKRETHAIA